MAAPTTGEQHAARVVEQQGRTERDKEFYSELLSPARLHDSLDVFA